MTLPEKAPLTATPPDPATLTIRARMFPSRSMGESSRFSFRLLESGIRSGAISAA